ncbi:MAG: hypothetical protein KDA37_18620, partial [Planctomycetales bacterium]|nr:hypothetical protein [Planctomycetales bacterium]
MVAAIIFGGSTSSGFLGDVVVQLCSIVVLVALIWVSSRTRNLHSSTPIFVVAGSLTLLAALQLFPVLGNPAFHNLVGPDSRLSASALPRTLTLTRSETWSSIASWLPPLAMFAAVAQLPQKDRVQLCWLTLALCGVCALLGLVQVAQGPDSELRFFTITNPTEAVGFFANRNHFAAQLCVALALSVVWFAVALQSTVRDGAINAQGSIGLVAVVVFIAGVMGALAVARSRAGVGLALLAVLGILVVYLREGASVWGG